MVSLVAFWRRDTARNTFYFLSFVNGFVFTLFGTYATSQLQTTGLAIGSSKNGGPCTVDCSVLMGTQRLDIQQVLLYLTAFTFGLSGFLALSLVWFADLWARKSLLVTGCTIIYGAVAIPVFWLTDATQSDFNSLFALSAVSGIMTTIFMSIISVYIPYCMRNIHRVDPESDTFGEIVVFDSFVASTAKERRDYAFAMSTLGIACDSGSGLLAITVVTGLSNTVSPSSAQNVGNLLTTITGFLTVGAVVGCYFGLPKLPTRQWNKSASKELIFPVRNLFVRPNAWLLLLSYTVYTAVVFALYSNLFQLFAVVVRPSPLEFSLFSLASSIFSWSSYVIYFFVRRKFEFNLELCLLFGYAFTLIVPVWGTIGMSNQASFGDKLRWEFYVQVFIYQVGGAIVNSTWRVLYAELIPVGEEFLWFGMQTVLLCATNWINPVTTASLQARTNLRFPMVICVIFGVMAVTMEALRINLSSCKEDTFRAQSRSSRNASSAGSLEEKLQDKSEAHSETRSLSLS